MANRRIDRLNEQLRRELAELLRTKARDPRLSEVTVTGVRTAPDLTLARIAVQIGGTDAERASALEGLEASAPFLRRLLGQDLHIRRVPELVFQEDRSLARAQRIEELLDEVRPDGGWVDGDDAEGDPDEDDGVDERDEDDGGGAGDREGGES